MLSDSETQSDVVTPEEITKLWLSENAIVNQKTAYFIAATAFLASATIVAITSPNPGRYIVPAASAIGLIFSIITFCSIARTCCYRNQLRIELERSPKYKNLLTPKNFPWYAELSSEFTLLLLPFLGVCTWMILLVSYLYTRR